MDPPPELYSVVEFDPFSESFASPFSIRVFFTSVPELVVNVAFRMSFGLAIEMFYSRFEQDEPEGLSGSPSDGDVDVGTDVGGVIPIGICGLGETRKNDIGTVCGRSGDVY